MKVECGFEAGSRRFFRQEEVPFRFAGTRRVQVLFVSAFFRQRRSKGAGDDFRRHLAAGGGQDQAACIDD